MKIQIPQDLYKATGDLLSRFFNLATKQNVGVHHLVRILNAHRKGLHGAVGIHRCQLRCDSVSIVSDATSVLAAGSLPELAIQVFDLLLDGLHSLTVHAGTRGFFLDWQQQEVAWSVILRNTLCSVVSLGAMEDPCKRIVVIGWNRIVFVIMAASASDGESEECLGSRVDLFVDHVRHELARILVVEMF